MSRARPLILTLFLLAAVACGDDGGGSGPTAPKTTSGKVTKNSVVGAAVSLFTVNAQGGPGTLVAGPFTTDANGAWTGEYPASASGPFVIVATGGSYVDEVSGATVNLGLAQLLGYSQGGSGQVTPVSQALYQAAQSRAAEAGISATQAWSDVISTFETAFGFDPSTTVPMVGGTNAQGNYMAILGGFSELIDANATITSITGAQVIDLVLALAADLSDGVFDGLDADGMAIEVPTSTGNVFLPALDQSGIGVLIDAANAFADNFPGLETIDLPDVDLDFGDPVVGNGSGSIMILGPDASLLPASTFVPAAFSGNELARVWSTGGAQGWSMSLSVGISSSDPTKAVLVTLAYADLENTYSWAAFSEILGSSVAGVTVGADEVTFDDAVLEAALNATGSVTLRGTIGE